jgi:hypothetical protein
MAKSKWSRASALFVGVALEEQLGEFESGEGDLRAEADLGAALWRLTIVAASLSGLSSVAAAVASTRARGKTRLRLRS